MISWNAVRRYILEKENALIDEHENPWDEPLLNLNNRDLVFIRRSGILKCDNRQLERYLLNCYDKTLDEFIY